MPRRTSRKVSRRKSPRRPPRKSLKVQRKKSMPKKSKRSSARKKSKRPLRKRSKSTRKPPKRTKSRRKSTKKSRKSRPKTCKDENYECECDYKYGKKKTYKYSCDCKYNNPKKSYKKKSKMILVDPRRGLYANQPYSQDELNALKLLTKFYPNNYYHYVRPEHQPKLDLITWYNSTGTVPYLDPGNLNAVIETYDDPSKTSITDIQQNITGLAQARDFLFASHQKRLKTDLDHANVAIKELIDIITQDNITIDPASLKLAVVASRNNFLDKDLTKDVMRRLEGVIGPTRLSRTNYLEKKRKFDTHLNYTDTLESAYNKINNLVERLTSKLNANTTLEDNLREINQILKDSQKYRDEIEEKNKEIEKKDEELREEIFKLKEQKGWPVDLVEKTINELVAANKKFAKDKRAEISELAHRLRVPVGSVAIRNKSIEMNKHRLAVPTDFPYSGQVADSKRPRFGFKSSRAQSSLNPGVASWEPDGAPNLACERAQRVRRCRRGAVGTPRKQVWRPKDSPKNRQIDELRELRSRELVGYGPTGVCPNPINRPRKYKVIIKNLAGEQIGGGEYWGDTLINTVRLDLIDNGVPKYEAKTGGILFLGDMEVSNPQRSLRTMAIRTNKQNDEYLEFTFIIPPVNQIINEINSYMKNNLEQVRTALTAPDPQGLFIDYGQFQEGRPIYQGRKWMGRDTSLCNTVLNPQTRYNVFSVPNGLFARFVTPHILNIDNEPSTPEQMAFAYRIWNGEINEDNNEIFDQQNESAFLFYNNMWRQYRVLCDSVCNKQRFRAIVHKRLAESGFSERYLQGTNYLYVDPKFLCDHRWDN